MLQPHQLHWALLNSNHDENIFNPYQNTNKYYKNKQQDGNNLKTVYIIT